MSLSTQKGAHLYTKLDSLRMPSSTKEIRRHWHGQPERVGWCWGGSNIATINHCLSLSLSLPLSPALGRKCTYIACISTKIHWPQLHVLLAALSQNYHHCIYQNESNTCTCSAAALSPTKNTSPSLNVSLCLPKLLLSIYKLDLFKACHPQHKCPDEAFMAGSSKRTGDLRRTAQIRQAHSHVSVSAAFLGKEYIKMDRWWRHGLDGSNGRSDGQCLCVCVFSWEDQKLTMQEVCVEWKRLWIPHDLLRRVCCLKQ